MFYRQKKVGKRLFFCYNKRTGKPDWLDSTCNGCFLRQVRCGKMKETETLRDELQH